MPRPKGGQSPVLTQHPRLTISHGLVLVCPPSHVAVSVKATSCQVLTVVTQRHQLSSAEHGGWFLMTVKVLSNLLCRFGERSNK